MSDFQKLYLSALETLNNYQTNNSPTPGEKQAVRLASAFVKLSQESAEMKFDLDELKVMGLVNELNQITPAGIYEINTDIKKLSNVKYTGRFIRMITEGFSRKIAGIYPILSKSVGELRGDVFDNLFSLVLKEAGNRYKKTEISVELAEQLSDFYENQVNLRMESPSLEVVATVLEETESVGVFEKKKKKESV